MTSNDRIRRFAPLALVAGLFVALSAILPACEQAVETSLRTAPAKDMQVAAPRNVILMIGDGMGFEHVRAARLFACGPKGKLAMEKLPVQGRMSTHPAGGPGAVTDSAAAGTALATGVKVANRVVSVRKPGDESPIPTILERLADQGFRTGLVSTSYLTHATPAAFAAHVDHREKLREIGKQYVTLTRPDLLLGGGGKGLDTAEAAANGYAVCTDRAGLDKQLAARPRRVLGAFGAGHMPYEFEAAMRIDPGYDRLPRLSEMVAASLKLLPREGRGMFLMIEGARIDHASHDNHIANGVLETLEFDNAVKVVLDWAKGRDDTLVVITADHECGGLKILADAGRSRWPEVAWASKHHTGVDVPLYAWGLGAGRFAGPLDNTDVPARIEQMLAESDPKLVTDAKHLEPAPPAYPAASR
jgi:alkaline phosphatase